MYGAITSTSPHAFVAWTGMTLPFKFATFMRDFEMLTAFWWILKSSEI
jgi:hypothetical protein